jgi:hypothetical protein
MDEENNYIKDAVKSVLRICSDHNKEGRADCSHCTNFASFELF